jgi:hypothetical protein
MDRGLGADEVVFFLQGVFTTKKGLKNDGDFADIFAKLAEVFLNDGAGDILVEQESIVLEE